MPGNHLVQTLATFFPAILILALVVLVSINTAVDFHDLAREGAFLSNAGIILWCSTAAICFFTHVTTVREKQASGFFLYSALLTAYLLIDDFFQVHEKVVPNLLGIDEKIIFICLGFAVIIYLFVYRNFILNKTRYVFLLTSMIFLASALAADGILAPLEVTYGLLSIMVLIFLFLVIFKRSHTIMFLPLVLVLSLCSMIYIFIHGNIEHPEYLLEDSAKWLGITFWFSYYVQTCYQFAQSENI